MQEEFADIFQELSLFLVVDFVNGLQNVDDPKIFKNMRSKFNELKLLELKISGINRLIEHKFNEIYEESESKYREDKRCHN